NPRRTDRIAGWHQIRADRARSLEDRRGSVHPAGSAPSGHYSGAGAGCGGGRMIHTKEIFNLDHLNNLSPLGHLELKLSQKVASFADSRMWEVYENGRFMC